MDPLEKIVCTCQAALMAAEVFLDEVLYDPECYSGARVTPHVRRSVSDCEKDDVALVCGSS